MGQMNNYVDHSTNIPFAPSPAEHTENSMSVNQVDDMSVIPISIPGFGQQASVGFNPSIVSESTVNKAYGLSGLSSAFSAKGSIGISAYNEGSKHPTSDIKGSKSSLK